MIAYAPDGKYLSVSPEDRSWYIRITRIDRKTCEEFGRYHGKTITAGDICGLLGNCNSLAWQPSRKGVGQSREITANAEGVHVALVVVDRSPFPDEEVIEEFHKFIHDNREEGR